MHEDLIIPIKYKFDKLGIRPHTLPNAIGMWPNEQECLLWCVLNSEPGDWLEIGSFCGGSAVLMGLASIATKNSNTVFTVDIDFSKHIPYVDVNLTNAGLLNKVKKIETDSTFLDSDRNLKNRKISFAFIDGFHSYNQVLLDFEALYPYFTDHAIVAFHDVSPKMYDKNCRQYVDTLKFDHELLIRDNSEDFRLDEAVSRILQMSPSWELLGIPIRKTETHFKETGLTEWVRGTTSPFNSFVAIQRRPYKELIVK